MRKIRQSIPIGKLALNEGQIDWLPRNPRQWTKDDIERMIKSLDEDPDFMEDRPPLVTPQEDGGFCVFAGNERTEAEKKRKKRQEIECVVYYPESDEDRETVIRRAIKDNGHFGSWDADILANEWDVPLEDWGVPDWVTGGAAPVASPAAKEDDFDEEKDEIHVRCKKGDIWQLGDHRLMCGDSTDLETLKRLMGGGIS